MDYTRQHDARSLLPEGEGPEQSGGGHVPASRGSGISAAPDIEDVIGYDALMDSLEKCLRGVRWKGGPAWFQLHSAEAVSRLCDELHDGTYEPRPVRRFEVRRPKPRLIVATDFRDRVVQRSFNDNLIYPLMSRSWIYDNCACQKGKGTDFARSRLKRHLHHHWMAHGMRGGIGVVDVRGYYDHMLHDVTERRFRSKLPRWGYSFVEQTLRGQYGSSGMGYNPGSQMVQIAGIDYLDPLDHLVKERMRIKGYVRYMDDLILMHEDECYMRECVGLIGWHLSEVGMEPHPRKTRVQGVGEPVGFLGFDFRLCPNGRVSMLVKPEKAKQARRDMRSLARLVRDGRLTRAQFEQSCQCRVAHAAKGDSGALPARLDEYRLYLEERMI